MRLKNLLPRTLLVVSLVLVVAVILTTRSAFVSADDQVPENLKTQTQTQTEQETDNSPKFVNNNSLSEPCPCIARDACPRIYGQSALDVRELGIVQPCLKYGEVRCCGVTISVVQKSDEGSDSSVSLIDGEEFEFEKSGVDGDEIVAGEESTATTASSDLSKDVESHEEDNSTTHPGAEIVELPLFDSGDKNSSESIKSESDVTEADLESSESVMIKTFQTPAGSRSRPIKMRRKKITTTLNSELSVDAEDSENGNQGEAGEFGESSIPEIGDSEGPGRVVVSAFAKESPNTRIASTTIVLEPPSSLESTSTSSGDRKIHNMQSPIRKLMKETTFPSTPTSGEENGNGDSSSVGNLPGKSFSTFGRQKIFSSHSQTGNTMSSSIVSGSSNSATAASIGTPTAVPTFRRPSAFSQGESTSQGTSDKADLISSPADETEHVDHKDKLESNERPMIRPFVTGGSRRKLTGALSSTNVNSTNSSSSSNNFVSTSTTFGRISTNRTRNNLLNSKTTSINTQVNIPSTSKQVPPASNNEPVTVTVATQNKFASKTSSNSSQNTFQPKIRPFNSKKTDGVGSVAITLNKMEPTTTKVGKVEEIQVTTGNKGISVALHSFKNNNKSSALLVNKTGAKLQPTVISSSPLQSSSTGTSLLSSLSHAQTSQSLGYLGDTLEKVPLRKPGIRRRKTTTTPAPETILEESSYRDKEDESNSQSQSAFSSHPLFAHTKSKSKSTSAPVQMNIEDNRAVPYESPVSPVRKLQSISPSRNGYSHSSQTSPPAENSQAPAVQPTLKRGYRKRLRPLAQTQTHPQDSSTLTLTQEEIMTLPIPTGTTEQPRVYSQPETENNAKDEKIYEGNENESLKTGSSTPANINEKISNPPAGESAVTLHSNPPSAGNYKSKFRQQLLMSSTTLPGETYTAEEYEQQKYGSTTTSDFDTLSSTYTTESYPNLVEAEAPARRKFFGDRFTTTGAPAVLIKPNSQAEEEYPLSKATTESDSSNNIKYPVRMTSTYSRIRVNNHNEEEGNKGTTFQHANNRPNSNRRFRIPASMQVLRGSSTSAPTSKFVDLGSSPGIPEEYHESNKNPSAPANYGGGYSASEGEEAESYDLILDKEARKSMYNQNATTKINFSSHSPSQSYHTEEGAQVQQYTTQTPFPVPADKNQNQGSTHQMVKLRRRRPRPGSDNTLIQHHSINFEEDEQKHLVEPAQNSSKEEKEGKKGENTPDNIEVVLEHVGNGKNSEDDVDIDLKVNIDVNVDNGNIEEEAEMGEYTQEEELETAGEQESRLHAKYVKRKFPSTFNRTTTAVQGNSDSNENGNVNANTADVTKSPGIVDTSSISSYSITNTADTQDNLDILSSSTPSTRVYRKKVRKPVRVNNNNDNNSPRFSADSLRSSTVKPGESFEEQVGHSRIPPMQKSSEISTPTRHTNIPDRFTFSSSSSSSSSNTNGNLARTPSRTAFRAPDSSRFQIKENSEISLPDDNDKDADSVIRTHNNYRVIPSSTPRPYSAPAPVPADETTESNSSPKFVFPPYRKSQSALTVSSTTLSPPLAFTPTRSRYSVRNRTMSSSNDKTTTTSATAVNSPNNNVESIVEFNSVPTRTPPSESFSSPAPAPAPNSHVSISNTNTFNRNTHEQNLNGNRQNVIIHANRNAINVNGETVKEHQESRFTVPQLSSSPQTTTNSHSNNSTRQKIRKKIKNPVVSNKGNEFSAPAAPPLPVQQEPVRPAIKNTLISSSDSRMPTPMYTTLSQNQPLQLATSTEPDFSYQIPPTESPYYSSRYTPTSPITPVTIPPVSYSIGIESEKTPAASPSPYPYQPHSPAPLPQLSPLLTTTEAPPTLSYHNNYNNNIPQQYSHNKINEEFSQLNYHSNSNSPNANNNPKTSSRFPVPEKFEFSGWRVSNPLPQRVTTPVTPTTLTVQQEVKQQEETGDSNSRNRFPPQQQVQPNYYNYVDSAPAPAPAYQQNNAQIQISQPQQQPQPQRTPVLQEFYSPSSSVNAKPQSTASPSTTIVQPAFDNFNYRVTSTNQGFSIQLADTNKPELSSTIEERPPAPPVPTSAPVSSFLPTQLSPLPHLPSQHQQQIQIQNSPALSYQQQQQQQQQRPIISNYQETGEENEGEEEEIQQNYFSPSPTPSGPGPLSYTLPILPQQNPKTHSTVSIQFGESINTNEEEYNNHLYSSQNQISPYSQQQQQLSHALKPEHSQSQLNSPSHFQSQPQYSASPAPAPTAAPVVDSIWKSQPLQQVQASLPQQQLQYPSSYSIGSNSNTVSPVNHPQQYLYSALNQNQNQNVKQSDSQIINYPSISNPSQQYQYQHQQQLQQPGGNYYSNIPIVLKESKLPSSAYQYLTQQTQTHPNPGYNSYTQAQLQAQAPQQSQTNVHGSFPPQSQQQQQSQQASSNSNPGQYSFSFNSQNYNGNPIVASKPVTIHALPVAVQQKLPSEQLKEYHQHMQISQHIMNHMGRYPGRTSRARNMSGDDLLVASGSENIEQIAAAPDSDNSNTVPVVDLDGNILNGTSTNSTLGDIIREGKGLEKITTGEELKVEESEKTEVYETIPAAVINELTLTLASSAPASQSEKSTEDAIAEGKQKQAAADSQNLSLKSDSKSPVSIDETSKDYSYGKETSGNFNSTENVDKQDFTPPKVIQGGFLPILPYSEKDPGPIFIKIQQKPDKLDTGSNRNLLNHPNGIPQNNFQHNNMHNQINKHYANAAKLSHPPK